MTPRGGSPKAWGTGAGILFPLLALGLWVGTPLGLGDAAYTAFLLVVLPALGVGQLSALGELGEEESLPRIPVYLSSGALILLIGWVALLVGGGSLGAEAMGIGPAPPGVVVAWMLGLTAAAVALLEGFNLLRRRVGIRESRLLAELLPRTLTEKGIFAGLSLAAGVGEELAFRGYLLPTLAGVTGSPWGAALLSSVVFGILHAYQGWLGVVRTGVLGLLLAASFLISGTLWPAILAHAIVDLLAGLVLGDALIKE